MSVYDANDKQTLCTKCKSLTEVAKLFGKEKACDISHLVYWKGDEARRREVMLNRWGLYFVLEREAASPPPSLVRAMQVDPC